METVAKPVQVDHKDHLVIMAMMEFLEDVVDQVKMVFLVRLERVDQMEIPVLKVKLLSVQWEWLEKMVREVTMEHLGYLAKTQKTNQENVVCLDQWAILVHRVRKDNLAAVRLEIILGHAGLQVNLAL